MAIEKMKLLSLVGALDEEYAILQELVLCEKVHLNLSHSEAYDNNYLMHEYEAMLPASSSVKEENYAELESSYYNILSNLETMAIDLELPMHFIKEDIKAYTRQQALEDYEKVQQSIGPNIEAISEKREQMKTLETLNQNLSCINRDIDFAELNHLNYFKYQVGMLSRDNRLHIKKNQENISALIFEIGEIEASREDIYIIFYLRELEEETEKLLKSLNWNKLELRPGAEGEVVACRKENESKIEILKKQIERLEKNIFENRGELILLLNKIYTRIKLELKIIELKKQVFRGNNVFVLSAWIRSKDYRRLDERIGDVTDKYVMMAKKPSELAQNVTPPTKLKNNWFFRPFELIVQLYGLPTYHEIDPTPFLAITFCLMFGIMFGDIGQGFIYFLAGFLISKKMETAGGILKRLGATSMIFGFVYGSVFGLEHLPVISDIALVQGGPLNKANIMPILIVGVAFGVAVLTISFLMGIINALKRKDLEQAFFGKNGIAGYIFFIGLISVALCLVKVIPVPVYVPVLVMLLMLVVMVFKEPLAHLMEGKRPLIHGDKGSYFIESGFEGIETILSTLSNAISFIRVGAFALNHAGLFMAFSVMAEMVPGIPLKIIILVLGNVLILTLEGLVVFIQGLRLQYYEMFSKYFGGDGIAYEPIQLEK